MNNTLPRLALGFAATLHASGVALANTDGVNSATPPSVVPQQLVLGKPAPAVRDGQAISDPQAPWTVQLRPLAWYAAFAGDVRVGGSPTSRKLDVRDINADSPRITPLAEVALRIPDKQLLFTLQGGGYSAESIWSPTAPIQVGTLALTPAQAVTNKFEMASFEAMGGYYWLLTDFDDNTGNTFLRLTCLGGLRVVDQTFRFTTSAGTTQTQSTYAAPAVGIKLDAQLSTEFVASVATTAGIWPDQSSFDIDTSFTYTPNGGWLGLQAGYRLLSIDYSSGSGADENSFSGSLAGLYFGVQIRF